MGRYAAAFLDNNFLRCDLLIRSLGVFGAGAAAVFFVLFYSRLLPQPAQHRAMVKARTLQNVQPGPTGTMAGLAWTRLQIVLVSNHMGLVELLILFNSTLLARGRVSVAENPPEGNVQPDLRLYCPYVSPRSQSGRSLSLSPNLRCHAVCGGCSKEL